MGQRDHSKRRQTQEDLALVRIRGSYRLWTVGLNGLFRVLTVASFSLPLLMVYLTVQSLAGQNTQVSAAVAYTVAAMVGSMSALAIFGSGFVKSKSRQQELERLRKRVWDLERELEDNRGNQRGAY